MFVWVLRKQAIIYITHATQTSQRCSDGLTASPPQLYRSLAIFRFRNNIRPLIAPFHSLYVLPQNSARDRDSDERSSSDVDVEFKDFPVNYLCYMKRTAWTKRRHVNTENTFGIRAMIVNAVQVNFHNWYEAIENENISLSTKLVYYSKYVRTNISNM